MEMNSSSSDEDSNPLGMKVRFSHYFLLPSFKDEYLKTNANRSKSTSSQTTRTSRMILRLNISPMLPTDSPT